MTESITLYHVSYDLSSKLEQRFDPRLPSNPMRGENTSIPRVCLSNTIVGCFNAMKENLKSRIDNHAANMIIWQKRFNLEDPSLVHWRTLYEKGLVPDAALTHEYWYKKPVTMSGAFFEIKQAGCGLIATEELLIEPKYRTMILEYFNEQGVYDSCFKCMDICTIVNRWLPSHQPQKCEELTEGIKELMRIPDPNSNIDEDIAITLFGEAPEKLTVYDYECQAIFKSIPMTRLG